MQPSTLGTAQWLNTPPSRCIATPPSKPVSAGKAIVIIGQEVLDQMVALHETGTAPIDDVGMIESQWPNDGGLADLTSSNTHR